MDTFQYVSLTSSMTPFAGLPVFYPRRHTVEGNAADPTRRLKIIFLHTNLYQ
jgi:hypothetical protein